MYEFQVPLRGVVRRGGNETQVDVVDVGGEEIVSGQVARYDVGVAADFQNGARGVGKRDVNDAIFDEGDEGVVLV